MNYRKLAILATLCGCVGLVSARDLSGFYISTGTGGSITSFSSIKRALVTSHGMRIYDWGDNINKFTSFENNFSSGIFGFPVFLGVGYRFTPTWGVELNAVHEGTQFIHMIDDDGKDIKDKFSQYYISANIVGYAPLIKNYLYLTGKLGIAKGDNYQTGVKLKDHYTTVSTIVPTMGIGLQYIMSKHLALDLDYTSTGLFHPMHFKYTPPKQLEDQKVPDTYVSTNSLFVKLTVLF